MEILFENIYKLFSKTFIDNSYIEIQRHNDLNEKQFESFNLNLSKKYNLPIIAIGLGEKEDDLELFKAEDYAKALMSSN